MTVNDTLVAFTLLVTMLAVVVGAMAYWEFSQIRTLRQNLQQFQIELRQQLFRAQKAQQRIIASYGMADPVQRIALLKSAIDADPDSFNGYNALGYACLDQGDLHAAIAAFKEASVRHPDAKEGYFDLAEAYRRLGRIDLCKAALEQAVKHDPTAKDDLANDSRFQNL
ncbi:MAG: tetratricopeptide repeat protein [Candidatus Competibacteraceae bacterium]|nr:MAG: tetratricopeptide repeat protein [Candidatus Competibacteraceae bacterium]